MNNDLIEKKIYKDFVVIQKEVPIHWIEIFGNRNRDYRWIDKVDTKLLSKKTLNEIFLEIIHYCYDTDTLYEYGFDKDSIKIVDWTINEDNKGHIVVKYSCEIPKEDFDDEDDSIKILLEEKELNNEIITKEIKIPTKSNKTVISEK